MALHLSPMKILLGDFFLSRRFQRARTIKSCWADIHLWYNNCVITIRIHVILIPMRYHCVLFLLFLLFIITFYSSCKGGRRSRVGTFRTNGQKYQGEICKIRNVLIVMVLFEQKMGSWVILSKIRKVSIGSNHTFIRLPFVTGSSYCYTPHKWSWHFKGVKTWRHYYVFN